MTLETLSVPAPVRPVLARLKEAGHAAFLVGGSVRDLLLSRPAADYDVATAARPEQVMALFPRSHPTGVAHGTVTVIEDGVAVEVTTFRREAGYSDRRRPDRVEFGASLEEDLLRRDYTVNAMAMSLEGRLEDPTGGRRDLVDGIIRAVGDPRRRFDEDALRPLRGVRLATELGFELEAGTWRAICKAAPLLAHVSRERVRDEFRRVLLADGVGRGLELLRRSGLLAQFLPELLEGVGVVQNHHHAYDVWEHTLRTVERVPPRLTLRWAALLHDVAKPRTLTEQGGQRHFYRHEVVGEELAARILTRLREERRRVAQVAALVRWHMALRPGLPYRDATLRRLIARVGEERVEDLLELWHADRSAHGGEDTEVAAVAALAARVRRLLSGERVFFPRDLAVDGRDVLALGIGPGPAVGKALQSLLAFVQEDPSRNRREVLLERLRQDSGRRI